jgi:hypothetical protein
MTITNLLYGKRRKNSSTQQNIFQNVHHGFTAELGPGITIADPIFVETSEATSVNTEAPVIIYRNDGLTIGLIVDDDGQSTHNTCSHTLL